MRDHGAYQSVHADIAKRLVGHEDLPLYITGHSLGGALAVVDLQSGQRYHAQYQHHQCHHGGEYGALNTKPGEVHRSVSQVAGK